MSLPFKPQDGQGYLISFNMGPAVKVLAKKQETLFKNKT
jgi:hypothetical protein